MNFVTIKNQRTLPLKQGQPWVFSGALVKKYEDISIGSIVDVVDENNNFIAKAFYNYKQSIAIRVLSWDKNELINKDFFINRFQLLKISKQRFLNNTNSYRLVNSDADYLPGLIVDIYDNVAVFQISLYAMEQYIADIVSALETIGFNTIIEKSDSNSRLIEDLKIKEVILHKGDKKSRYAFIENNMRFYSDPFEGQKTGFFLDQRDARFWLLNNSKDKKVINLFSYSGGFSVAALKAGASEVISVDISKDAMILCEENITLNTDISKDNHQAVVADVFEYIENSLLMADIIICDPPAFAKNKKSLDNALKAYIKLNSKILSKMNSGSILITSSCSGLIKMVDFVNILKRASLQSGKKVKILSQLKQASDHSILLGFEEGEYLKTLILEVI